VGYNPVVQMLANRGYLVIQVNYRGSFGYGKQHLAAGNREHPAQVHTDVLDALDWAIGQGWADPDGVAGLGNSYGGYEVLIGVTHTPGVYACGVATCAPVNLSTEIKATPPWAQAMLSSLYDTYGNPDTEADLLWDRSPLSRAEHIDVPLLLAVGAHNHIVPKTEADQLTNVLAGNGIAHTYLSYSDEGHGLTRPINRQHFYAVAEQFLAEHIGGRAQPLNDQPIPDSLTETTQPLDPQPSKA
jgi:dipeptidyl aminopeptidase/acylaminoacyl peptidase